MRDKRFIAVHCGGPLPKEQHQHLMVWACACAENVLPLFTEKPDERLNEALKVGKEWAKGNATVGDARKASLQAIAVAREVSNLIYKSVARSVGHAVATAHMADHCIRTAEYALKAINLAGKSVETERKWQDEQLSSDIAELVLTARNK